MNKTLSVLLCLATLLSLCACGTEQQEEASEAMTEENAVIRVARCGSAVNCPPLFIPYSQYKFECEDYGDQEMDRLRTEIISGDCPDLILFNNNLETASPLFEDLYSFLDDDPELSRGSFLPNYLSSLEVNGEVHELWTNCAVMTVAARASDVGDGNGITTADYDRILAENDSYEAVFDNYMTKDELLLWIAEISLGEYVDKENASCRFDDASFSDLLEWCGKMTEGFAHGETAWGYDISQLVLYTLWLEQADTVHELWNAFGEEPVFAGFPTRNGYANYFYSIYGNCCMAIPKNSQNKEGAWAYIRNQLLPKKQMLSSGLPVNYEVFQEKAHKALNDEEYDILIALLEHTTKNVNYSDQKLREIIITVGTSYINGQKSLEEAVELIQSKASIYVSELYG